VNDLGATDGGTVLEMRGITKRFPEVVANDHVDFDLRRGEIHSILGENGAGKTTLMNILYGIYRMDEGEIRVKGQRVSIGAPKEAIDLGIGMIHQSFTLVAGQTVLDNIILGREPTRGPFLDRKRAEGEIIELGDMFNLKVDLEARPEHLPASGKQKVEILKALYQGAEILVMDEPTSVLLPHEKEELMTALKEMTGEGFISVIFITHKLPEALEISDRITILRRGRVVDTINAGDVDVKDLARMMVGRDVLFDIERSESERGEGLLEVEGLEAFKDTGVRTLKGVSFEVRGGEILGIAGVSGNGQEELVDVIMGLRKASAGKVLIRSEDATNFSPKDIRALGVGYIPEDRMGRGVMPELSIRENIMLGTHSRRPFANRGALPFENLWFINQDQVDEYAKRLVEEYNIDTPSVVKPAGRLSGGNLQKLILARELSRDPQLLIADKPTSGLDIGSQEFIRRKLMGKRDEGKAILLISEDLDEVLGMSDRIAIMYEGRIVNIVQAKRVSKEQIGEMITGALTTLRNIRTSRSSRPST